MLKTLTKILRSLSNEALFIVAIKSPYFMKEDLKYGL